MPASIVNGGVLSVSGGSRVHSTQWLVDTSPMTGLNLMLFPGPFVGCCAAGMLSHDGRLVYPDMCSCRHGSAPILSCSTGVSRSTPRPMGMPEVSCDALSLKRAMLSLTEAFCKLQQSLFPLCVPNFKVWCSVLQIEAVRSVHRVHLLFGRQPVKPGVGQPFAVFHGVSCAVLYLAGRSKRELDCSERAGSGRIACSPGPKV